MKPSRLADAAALDRALAAPEFLLFKHSLICPISAAAFAEYEAFVAAHPAVATAWVDVIGQRPIAQDIARRTGVKHESPQALLLRAGRVVWHASHGKITRASLAAALVVR